MMLYPVVDSCRFWNSSVSQNHLTSLKFFNILKKSISFQISPYATTRTKISDTHFCPLVSPVVCFLPIPLSNYHPTPISFLEQKGILKTLFTIFGYAKYHILKYQIKLFNKTHFVFLIFYITFQKRIEWKTWFLFKM